MKVILIPGMGCTPVASSNWYSWFADSMRERKIQCCLQDFPDPHQCRESIWLPHVEAMIDDNPGDTIVVGHSSGAACAMRLLEKCEENPLAGVVLVAAAHTDLGDEDERKSQYFSRPWDWDAMRKGAASIVMFHGTDDHLIPVTEARHIAAQLQEDVKFYEMEGKSHFFHPWPEILHAIDKMVEMQ